MSEFSENEAMLKLLYAKRRKYQKGIEPVLKKIAKLNEKIEALEINQKLLDADYYF